MFSSDMFSKGLCLFVSLILTLEVAINHTHLGLSALTLCFLGTLVFEYTVSNIDLTL